eukprot:CAMPEP_0185729020 /NCGR_PEP_ID=MMETSP1171-20130828/4425_1 /TAXON_ID=374046 /ORGANISM="Helicotheca tamensis, Strain CCMP826" /LENGTH=92 /DNA_ID=CAMNT_0028397785 /DNA_START=53 /DNA_END=327 /DNA_ORIENTATION=+
MPRIQTQMLRLFTAITSITGAWSFQLQPRRTFPTSLHSAYSSFASTVVNIDENAPREIQAMEEWAGACGVQKAEGFRLTSDDEYGLDVYAMT